MVETCRDAQRRGTLTICKQKAHQKWLTPFQKDTISHAHIHTERLQTAEAVLGTRIRDTTDNSLQQQQLSEILAPIGVLNHCNMKNNETAADTGPSQNSPV